MTDKIAKALSRFFQKEKEFVKNLLLKIYKRDVAGLNLKKLKGRNDIYRIRKRKIRIVYKIDEKQIYLLAIERRCEHSFSDI
ncbi:MAG: hypothetical protein WC459_05155 [Patescibacteria group bacterium]